MWTREDLAKRSDDQVDAIAARVCNRLAKWRVVFAGWQLGLRLDSDPESQAVRDHRELTMLMRAEINALTRCLIDAWVFTNRDFIEQVILEAEHLSTLYERKFPGMKAADSGISMDVKQAAETMKGWRP